MCCCTQLLPGGGGHPAAVGCSARGWGPHWHWDLQGHQWFGGATGPCQGLVSAGMRDARLPGPGSSWVPAPSAGPASPAPTWIRWEQLHRGLWKAVVTVDGCATARSSSIWRVSCAAVSFHGSLHPPVRCAGRVGSCDRCQGFTPGCHSLPRAKRNEGLSPQLLLGAAALAPLGFSHGTARGEEPWGATGLWSKHQSWDRGDPGRAPSERGRAAGCGEQAAPFRGRPEPKLLEKPLCCGGAASGQLGLVMPGHRGEGCSRQGEAQPRIT